MASFAHTVGAAGDEVSQAVGEFVDSVSDSLRIAAGVNADTHTRIRAAHDALLDQVAAREAALEKLESL